MQRQAIVSMLEAIAKLQEVNTGRKSVSNSKMMLVHFKNLRAAYSKLDQTTKLSINDFLKINHQELLILLARASGQITNIPELGRMIDNELLNTLQSILQAAPVYLSESESTHTGLLRKMSDNKLPDFDSGTVKVAAKTEVSGSSRNQLILAINSPHLKKLSSSYLNHLTHGAPENIHQHDMLTIITESFEKLLKNKEIMLKEQKSGAANESHIRAYQRTIREVVNKLNSKSHINMLTNLANQLPACIQLKNIIKLLSIMPDDNNHNDDERFTLAIGEAMSLLLDNELIASLQKYKIDRQQTRHYQPSM